MESKVWYLSKTLWVNLLIAIFIIVQGVTGVEVASTEVEALATVCLNVILRFVSQDKVTLKKEQ